MVRKGTLAILAGLTLLVGGATSGAIHTSKRQSQETNTIIKHYLATKLFNISAKDRAGYIPQERLPDYSESQAHSEIENAHQELEATRGELEGFGKLPEVKRYNLTVGMEAASYFGAVAGLALFVIGGRRRLLNSSD